MAEKNKTTGEENISATSAMQAVAELQKVGFGSIAWMGTAWLEQMSEMGSEWLSFVADRIKEDVKTQHQILHCRNIEEVQKVQAQFIQTAVEQYRDETGKMVEMSSTMMEKLKEASKEPPAGKRHATPI
ncbi:phasin family protein [Sulfitobacter sabulilitoris]|uniref:Phasin family protein n=1 Tax=Sulfitobacter sabulilitoris TaxID=2562655 RepID=A0A5S3PC10_9RHOB|nr:phasin family protein [Sulfitobacter sabulilitoris]TMM51205.1 phasin family protein [Sulfitobacter sabulilitoris]